jgi:serpin B
MKPFSSARLRLAAGLLVAAASARSAETGLVAGNSAFATELYAKIAPPNGNLFFSPYSISLALALAYAGARGETAAEMARALHLPGDAAAAAQGFADLAGRLAALPVADATLTIGNSLWYQREVRLLPAYRELARRSYQAEIEPVDFLAAPGAACADINRWVSRATHGKIQNLVSPANVGSATRVVLANAIYFKGRWTSPFQRVETDSEPVFSGAGPSVRVPMMRQRAEYRFVQLPGFRLLELPYQGDDLAMVVLLPDAVDGLAAVERQLSGANLAAWLGRLNSAGRYEVALGLPRFSASTAFDLASALRQLGLAAAFDSQRADFSGIAPGRDFYLSQVLHKAEVEVNEEGTVAAAATGAVMHSLALRPAAEFRINHPFLFLIRENTTGTLLFIGRITDPRP